MPGTLTPGSGEAEQRFARCETRLGRLVGALPLRSARPTSCARRSRATRRSPPPRPRWRSAQDALAQARAAFYPQIERIRQRRAPEDRVARQHRDAEPGLQPVLARTDGELLAGRLRRHATAGRAGGRAGGEPAVPARGGLSHAHRQRRLAGDHHRRLPARRSPRPRRSSTTTRRTSISCVPSSTPARPRRPTS